MIFQFLHFNHPCTAYVIYEPMQVKDTMVVYLLDFNSELGNEIFFVENEEKKWITLSNIKNKYPDTYNDLCNKLTELFIDYKFEFECTFSKKEIV